MKHRLRSLLLGFTLALFSLAAALLLLEGLTRLLGLAAPAEPTGNFWRADPETGWSLQPGATGRWFNPPYEYDVDVVINSQGLRDVERVGYDKPDGVFRILLLGDSYVEGLRVPLEQTFGKVLEAALNASAPAGLRYEVVNAGVSGWGTDQQLLWLRSEGAKYQPDLVLLAFFPGNDFQNVSEALEVANMGRVQKPFFQRTADGLALRYHPFDHETVPQPAPSADLVETVPTRAAQRLAGLRAWLSQHSALHRFVATTVEEAVPALALRLAGWGLIDAPRAASVARMGPQYIPVAYGIYRQPLEADWTEAIALASDLVTALRDEAAVLGSDLAVVSVPAPEQVNPERWQRAVQRYSAMQTGQWDLEQPSRAAQQVAQQAGVPFLDLLPIFQEAAASSEPLHLRVDGHWTPAGERLAGEAVADFLRAAELLAP